MALFHKLKESELSAENRTWQRSVIGIENSSFKSDTVEIIGATWRKRLVWKGNVV